MAEAFFQPTDSSVGIEEKIYEAMKNPTIICFGEVLWDLLPSGRVAGGAPMNVAFHANQLGMRAEVISKIGDDDLGKEIKGFLENKGVSTDLIQTDETFPTGIVNVTLASGTSPSYEIVSPVAWDYILVDESAKNAVRHAAVLVFGSLACRTERNKKTLFTYLELAPLRVFDINLRAPYYSQALIEELLAQTDILKLNDEELVLLVGWLGLSGSEREQLNFIKNNYKLDAIILTKGKDGAACLHETGYFEHPGFQVTVQDTVGSGDSFLAAFLSRYLNGASVPDCLVFAGAVGAYVATQKGGTPEIDPEAIEALIN